MGLTLLIGGAGLLQALIGGDSYFGDEICFFPLVWLIGALTLVAALVYAPKDLMAGRQYRMISGMALLAFPVYIFYLFRQEGDLSLAWTALQLSLIIGMAGLVRHVEEIPPLHRLTLGLLTGLLLTGGEILMVMVKGADPREPWLIGVMGGLLLLYWMSEEFEPELELHWQAATRAMGLALLAMAGQLMWALWPAWPGVLLLVGWAGAGLLCFALSYGPAKQGRAILRPAFLLGAAVVLAGSGLLLATIEKFALAAVEGGLALGLFYLGFPAGLSARHRGCLGYLVGLAAVTMGYLFWRL